MSKKYVILTTLLLVGCIHVGPDFKSPKVPGQAEWVEKSESIIPSDEEIEIGKWWENYNDETLDTIVEYALNANFTLEAAAYRIIAARANLGFAIGQYFPQTQQLEGVSLRTHISANAANTRLLDRDFRENISGLRLAWELDFWGRFYRGVQVAKGQYAATENDYQDLTRLLISDLVFAYVQQKTIQRRIITLENNIAIQLRSVEIAKVRWQEGYDSELDYEQAVALWKETIAQKVSLEIELKRANTSIAILSGVTPEDFICLFSINSDPIEPPLSALIGYPVQILRQRPDLRRSLNLLYAQSARIGIAISDLLPRISFTGFLGLQCDSSTNTSFNQHHRHFFSPSSLTFFYGPEFAWPILNYGRLENRVKEQYALLDEGIASYRNQVLQVYKEVEDALTYYAKSQEQVANLEQSFKAAKRSVDISLLQYREGLADYTKVLNSLQLQVAIEDNLVQARGNIGLAYAAIYKAFGSY